MSKGKRAVEWFIRAVIFAVVMLGADVLAVLALLCGAGKAGFLAIMVAGAVAGAALARRATRPGVGPSRRPAPYGTSAPRKLASRKIENLG